MESLCLEIIKRYAAKGVSPSKRELCAEMGGGMANVYRSLASLEWRGMISQRPNEPRSITLLIDNPAYTEASLRALSPGARSQLYGTILSIMIEDRKRAAA